MFFKLLDQIYSKKIFNILFYAIKIVSIMIELGNLLNFYSIV